MNQILQVQEKKSKKIRKSIDTKKIVLFFAICIIIFGSIMVVEGAYFIYQERANQKVNPEPDDTEELEYLPPNINLTRTEDNKVIIKVDSEVEISHIMYEWNNEASQTIDESGKTNIEETINIPTGRNTLNITVIDVNGKETKKTKTYIVEGGKPIISHTVLGRSEIRIVVTSDVDLDYVTYKWNSEEQQKFDMHTYEDKTKFEKKVKIPKGQNTLKITAVDKNGIKEEQTMQIEGVTTAKTSTIVKGEYIYFNVIAETYYIDYVEFEFNGKKYRMDSSAFGMTKEVNYRLKMQKGWNYLKIVSALKKDNYDTTNSTLWKFEYIPQK